MILIGARLGFKQRIMLFRKDKTMKKTVKNRISAFVISILMVVSIFPIGIYATDAVPEGTAITTAEEFAAMQADGHYYLANDITIKTTYSKEFNGIFDGNGKTITTSRAIFDKVTGGIVKNFSVQAAGTMIVLPTGGAAVCNVAFGATFKNITNNADLLSTDANTNHGLAAIVGSVAGDRSVETTITIEGCVNKGNIKGDSKRTHAAGIIGFACLTDKELVNLEVTDCHNEGTVEAAKAGGIVSYIDGVKATSIKSCSNSGNLTSYNLGGGMISQITKTCSTLTVDNCTNSGNISGTGNKFNGGIVGICQIAGEPFDCTGSIAFRSCLNSGTVTGVGTGSHCGGIVGRHYGALIEYCGNTGLIENADACGGITGHTENANITRYCFNLGTVKSTKYSSGIIAVTKTPIDKIYGCYNAGQITMEDTFDAVKFNIAQIASITSNNYGEYYDNYYLAGMTFTHPDFGDIDIPCGAIGNSPVNDDNFSFAAEDLTSGKLAVDINEALGKNVYHQTLNGTKDAYPTPDSTRGTVVKAGDLYCNLDFSTAESAATKLEGNGLRFTTAINKADYDALLNAGIQASEITVGTMITLADYIGEMSLNMNDFDMAQKAYINDAGTLSEKDGNYVFNGAVINIPDDKIEKDYCAVGYIKIGDAVYYSAEYATRSVSDVAEAAYLDRSDVQTGEYVNPVATNSENAIDAKASYSPYTELQLADLKARVILK